MMYQPWRVDDDAIVDTDPFGVTIVNSIEEGLTENLHEIAVSIAVNAARTARFRRSAGVDVAYTKSTLTDVVTESDRETEQLIRSAVAAARPEDGFVGEEFDATPSTSGLHWVVDPIDGTVNYLYGLSPCAVSVAVVAGDPWSDSWEVVVGVVASIFDDRVYSAITGKGAFLDGVRLRVGAETEHKFTLACTGMSYVPAVRTRQAEVVRHLLGEVRDIRRIGCASLEICALAAGAVDFYYDQGLQPWDYSAATLIAREAGAVVRGRAGAARPSGDLTVAANPNLIETLQPRLEQWLLDQNL
ncbi:inositol monophosphatase family protein [Microbacterium sp. YY-01]|uniref:inositol monophosphatase family protein n=1 Tax=Microbacterium sp. YY-01 TaxID=3421634 RepID=UPI003D16C639